MTRTVDRTKKSNIKCEHCRYCEKHSGQVTYSEIPTFPGVEDITIPTWTTDMDVCRCADSPKANKPIYYYNRCKKFEWEN